MKKLCAYCLCFFVVFLCGCKEEKQGHASSLPTFKDGDIVFQTLATAQSAGIIAATGSPYTHVGFIKMTKDGPVVVEAVGPVKETPWTTWQKRGVKGKVMVGRIKTLTPKQASAVLKGAHQYYGAPYDFYFSFDNKALYCSEFVYLAFKKGASVDLGRIERLGDLGLNAPAAKALMQERWQGHPACQSIPDFESCAPILFDQTLITPGAIAADPRLEVLYTKYE